MPRNWNDFSLWTCIFCSSSPAMLHGITPLRLLFFFWEWWALHCSLCCCRHCYRHHIADADALSEPTEWCGTKQITSNWHWHADRRMECCSNENSCWSLCAKRSHSSCTLIPFAIHFCDTFSRCNLHATCFQLIEFIVRSVCRSYYHMSVINRQLNRCSLALGSMWVMQRNGRKNKKLRSNTTNTIYICAKEKSRHNEELYNIDGRTIGEEQSERKKKKKKKINAAQKNQ